MNHPLHRLTVTCSGLLLVVLATNSGCAPFSAGHNLQGVREFQSGNLDEAERRFRTAVQMNPNSADAHYNLAATLHRKAIRDNDEALIAEAERTYDACLNIDEDHAEAHREWAVLLAQTGRSQAAFRLLKNWKLRSQSPDARVELARLYEEFGDADSARYYLDEALEISPYHPKARAALAYLQERSGEFDEAVGNYELALRRQRDPKVVERLARIGSYSPSPTTQTAQRRTGQRQAASSGWTKRY